LLSRQKDIWVKEKKAIISKVDALGSALKLMAALSRRIGYH